MDLDSLFSKTSKNKANGDIPESRILSYDRILVNLPLVYGFDHSLCQHDFVLANDPGIQVAHRLREGEIEIGLIPAVEYARRKEIWNIVPGLAISAAGALKNVQLYFKKGLKEISSVAIDKNATQEEILLKILMREKYTMSPDYIRMQPELDAMLLKADAALLVGDAALKYHSSNRNRLDLGEEWYDMTSLPYVLSFWAGRQFTIRTADVASIKKSYELGARNLMPISKKYAEDHSEHWGLYHDMLTKDLSYTFNEDVKDGLIEFYNYAFYFGHIAHIPDFHYY